MCAEVVQELRVQRAQEIKAQGEDRELLDLTRDWFNKSCETNYSFHFDWLSRPIMQYPQDMVALQEIIWRVKPDLIIECGIAHGGSLIYNASLLALIDYCSTAENKTVLDPHKTYSKVLGIDIDIRKHNREAIEAHPLKHKIDMIEGSSIDSSIITRVKSIAEKYDTVLVLLDSNHTHDHVLAELEAYAELASVNSYCVVFDTVIEDMPSDVHDNRPWEPGNSPKTAVWKFLETHKNFEIDHDIDSKLLISVAPHGYLKKMSS
jgi:cephalosporin hydroxylase